MKKTFKMVLLVWPLVLLLGTCGFHSYKRHQIDLEMEEADGLVWKNGNDQFTVHVSKHVDGELLDFTIMVTGPSNKSVYKKNVTINRDMWGGGFVKAMQADQDPEKELVVWGSRESFFLDFKTGKVDPVPFSRATQRVKNLSETWHHYNVMADLEIGILFTIAFGYYVLYVLIKGAMWLIRGRKTEPSGE